MEPVTSTQWIADPAALDEFVAAAPPGAVFGLDTEFMRRSTYFPRLALLQIEVAGRVALVDPLTVTPNTALRARLETGNTVCVMHSAGEDIEALAAWLPTGPARLFDTQIAAALAGHGAGLGYQKLVAEITGVELPKSETCSDWLQRPLTVAQQQYAAQDVAFFDAIHAQLHGQLAGLGRLEWLAEDCARLCRRHAASTGDSQPQLALHMAAEWRVEQQALLRRVLLWREATARRVDTPRPWLVDDKQALDLVATPPVSGDELRDRTRGQRALRGPLRGELLDTLQRPLEADEIHATQAIVPAPERQDRDALKALKGVVNGVAASLGIPPGLLCPRRLLEEFLMTRTWPEALTGWREPLLRTPLEAHLP